MQRVSILPLHPFDRVYDYVIPEEIVGGETLPLGSVVEIPLGRRQTMGVILQDTSADPAPTYTLKPIIRLMDTPPLDATLRRFMEWVATYTMTPKGKILKMILSVEDALEFPKKAPAPTDTPHAKPHPVTLTPAQEEAAAEIRAAVQAPQHQVFFLDGVTGSGKTEVYFEGIETALAAGRQTLVLLPEIALSIQWLERFKHRFGFAPTPWHSNLTPAKRRDAWRAITRGEARVVVGARSALFLPFPNLGYIVVDEEHDTTYKQDDPPVYHARDMAIVRAQLSKFPITLASATPSLETYLNAKKGKYRHLILESRYGAARMPDVQLVDMRAHGTKGRETTWISPPLRTAIAEALERGEQALLFLNRRGYAPLTLCAACGTRVQCIQCATWLVYHQGKNHLQCHQCGHTQPFPKACPRCSTGNSFVFCGPGVERVQEEAALAFPHARTTVLTRDTLQNPKIATEIIQQIENHDVDMIIGTQVIAKGHHFPKLTCVGVIDGDIGLQGGDLRAAEKTFQLLTQVSGRAGRAERSGSVWVQTYNPASELLNALQRGERDTFLDLEAAQREAAHLSPYARLVGLVVSGARESDVKAWAQHLARHIPRAPGVDVLGPAPAPLFLLRGKYRWRLLVRAVSNVSLQSILRPWLEATPPPAGVKVLVDVDPHHFM